MAFHKIINDPVYGFISIDDELINDIISHPFFQRLRRIQQMALAHLVYPGAVHSRLHHALGAYHLMRCALHELIIKRVEITPEEQQAAKIAILLHDAGHGPFSHALEHVLTKGMHHEDISILIIKKLNEEFNGKLKTAIEIFTANYHKKFLHQLVSGQLDVDRLDYLTRDSFFTGVNEGVIAYDRILKMLTVHNGELMVEEKGIHSIEKFLLARRLMFLQVYLHKTVLSSEQMLQRIIKRAREISAECYGPLNNFINNKEENITLEMFCNIDDVDVMMAIKLWQNHPDKVLSILCSGIIKRKLFKVIYSNSPEFSDELKIQRQRIIKTYNLSDKEAEWLAFTGEAVSSTYNFEYEPIHIIFKDGTIKEISEVDNALINENLKDKIKKYYICYLR